MLYDKRTLYLNIENKLCDMGFDVDSPLDVMNAVKREAIELKFLPFSSDSIGAVLIKNKLSGILVNENKSSFDQRFDIAHELIHFWFHPNKTCFSFLNLEGRDRAKEWQANEGAAQLLLPYQDFIPYFINEAKFAEENYEPLETVYFNLSSHYRVAPIVIDYRIRNLESEILQFYHGVDINHILISHSTMSFNKNKQLKVYESLLKKISM